MRSQQRRFLPVVVFLSYAHLHAQLELIILSLSSIAQKLKFAGKGLIQIHMLYI